MNKTNENQSISKNEPPQLNSAINEVRKVNEYVSKHDFMFRICIIGDANVGKTTLLTRYCDNVFKENYTNTIGVDFRLITLKYGDIIAKMHIWDTAGQERFKSIAVNYFRSTHGFIFVYDISDRESFVNLSNWFDLAFNVNRTSFVNFLIGNKKDLDGERQVSTEEAQEIAEKRNFVFLETSAKTAENVQKAFGLMAIKLIEYYSKNQSAYESVDKDKEKDKLKIEDVHVDLNIKKKSNCPC